MPPTRYIQTARQFQFLQRLTLARERLLKSFAGLSQTALCTEPVAGDWTIKDILGHLSTWNDEFRAALRDILKKESAQQKRLTYDKNDFVDWEQFGMAEKRKWSWKRIRADFDRDYDEGVELILNLKPREFRQYGMVPWTIKPSRKMTKENTPKLERVETLVTFHWRHMNFHSRLIEKWREKKETD
ncbi:MAG: DinB family protein [Chloroflexi bacterium]|nr:DinB family protein [Chloroflexota bacterium]